MKNFVKTILIIFLLNSVAFCINTNGTGGGDYTAGATWNGGVAPADGETAVVLVGDTMIFDEDMSGWANGIDLTINGTMTQDIVADSYLKCSADVDGGGTWNIGTSLAVPFPAARTTTINLAGAFSIRGYGGLTLNWYCTQPTNTYIRLSGNEAADQTELSVDTDVTGDIWAVGDDIRVNNIDKGADSEEVQIKAGGIAAGAITIEGGAGAGGGLAGAKLEGSLVVLVTRNIRVINSTTYAIEYADDSYIACEISDCTHGLYRCNDTEFAGVLNVTTNA